MIDIGYYFFPLFFQLVDLGLDNFIVLIFEDLIDQKKKDEADHAYSNAKKKEHPWMRDHGSSIIVKEHRSDESNEYKE